MPSLDPEIGLVLWTRASEAEIGIAVKTPNKPLLKSELYRLRQEAQDPALDAIIICDPKGDEIFLVKKATELD